MRHPRPRFFFRFGLLLATLVNAGVVLAQAPESPRVLISDGTISWLTEVPVGDSLLPNSQVYLGGKANFSKFLGLLGVAIDSSRNEAKGGSDAATLALKFTDEVQASLTPNGSETPSSSLFRIVADGPYDIKLIPSARFSVDDESAASLTFRLAARSKVPGSDSEVTRNYYSPVFGTRPMTGEGSWSGDGGASLREAARGAFAAMASVLIHDKDGRYSEKLNDGNQKPSQFYGKDGRPFSVIVVEETPEFLVWVPLIRDKPFKSVIMVVDRRIVRTEKP